MSLAKAFEAKNIEAKWYKTWNDNGYFKPNPQAAKAPYCIVIPPPNVTGVLHMGHALVNTLQDVLIRWKRMQGHNTVWIPGTDHAGIATQTVVERHLIKTEGKRRKDYSRENFLSHVWKWKEENSGLIIQQLQRLGCSCDWSRLRFTMDEGNNLAVRTIFKKLYDAKLIYKGDYLVNWDPVTQTALADDEVEYEEKNSYLWTFNYPLEGGGFLPIATTRPETMLGDTAVAVSPKDTRLSSLIGKTVILPFSGRKIPVIADPFVDPSFGTGAVKITPAHDPNDYEMGLRHQLPFINIMTPDGKINEEGGLFSGMKMQEARDAVVKEMEKLGLFVKQEPHMLRVGVSYRSKAIIEPYMSKQWFVKMTTFKSSLRKVVEEGRVKLIPKSWESTYFHWIDQLRDWCISRQLWWGHRIPIWYRKDDPEKILCYDGLGLPNEVRDDPENWIQEEDVLDTWFSSALWPFAALGWPEKTSDFQTFYPNSVLVTGHDILFFWVARMLMMGEFACNLPPFPETFLHGLIFAKSYWRQQKGGGITYVSEEERQAFDLGKLPPKEVQFKWEKMSKSKGNVIDPIEIIDVYGTDAMRMALCSSATHAREIDLDRRRFEEFKNFANKIWNGARFIFMHLEEGDHGLPKLSKEDFARGIDPLTLTLEDRWIFSLLNKIVYEVNEHLNLYQFDLAAQKAYNFFWNDFCAYYLEVSKPVLFGKVGGPKERLNKQKILAIVLCQALRLIHPMAPFITEELFQKLKELLENSDAIECDSYTKETLIALQKESCMIAPYPVSELQAVDQEAIFAFEKMQALVYAVRNIRGEMGISPGASCELYLVADPAHAESLLIKENLGILFALIKLENVHFKEKEPKLSFAATGIAGALKFLIPLPSKQLEQEKMRLSKVKDQLEGVVMSLSKTFSDESFVSKAPAQVVEKQKNALLKAKNDLNEVIAKLQQLSEV